MEHLSEFEEFASRWPNPPQDLSTEEQAYWDEHLAIEENGGEGAIWLRLA